MAERRLTLDHTTIWRWIQWYGPEVHQRLHGQMKLKSSTWHVDETSVGVAGQRRYLFRAVDNPGADSGLLSFRDAGPGSSQMLSQDVVGESRQSPATRVCSGWAAELSPPRSVTCRVKGDSLDAVGTEPGATPTIELNRTIDPSSGGCERCKVRGPCLRLRR